MKAFSLFGPSDTLSLIGAASSSVSSRNQLSFPQRLFFCRANNDGLVSVVNVPPNLLLAEREEAKAVLHLFLKKQGMSGPFASKMVNKSDVFIDHLISRLHYVHRARYLVGRELTTLEIRDALIPYLDELREEHGDTMIDLLEHFPFPPVKEKSEEITKKPPVNVKKVEEKSEEIGQKPLVNVKKSSTTPISSLESTGNSMKERAMARVSDIGPTEDLPPHIVYLVDLGMELHDIKEVIKKFPAFAYYSLEGKIRPVVEFLLDLGITKSDIPAIIRKRPQLCGISLSENLIPTMAFLEDLGVEKKQWPKVIHRFPALLTYSRSKLQATVDFLYEMRVSSANTGKILTRCPSIMSYSVEEKLRPTADYFRSLGIDVALLLSRCPQVFGLRLEANLKPVTEFFLKRGYSIDEVATMVSRYGTLYSFSLANLELKWEYFLTMDYSQDELVKFPQYFGYSLDRIKPRHAIVKESGIKLVLNQMLTLPDDQFNEVLERKLKKKTPDL